MTDQFNKIKTMINTSLQDIMTVVNTIENITDSNPKKIDLMRNDTMLDLSPYIDSHYQNQQNYSWADYTLAIAAVATTLVTAVFIYTCATCTTKYCSGTNADTYTFLEGEV